MKISFTDIWRFIKKPQWFYVTIIALFYFAVACYANIKAIDTPVYHMDGAFQTASGLFRLLYGELPGRDFYPYLGVGPIALIFPLFLIAGAHLSASIFASYVMVFTANMLSTALIIHFIWKPKHFLLSVVSACALFSLPPFLIMNTSPFFGMYPMPLWLESITVPGNSLRPLRGFIGYLAIFALYFIISPEKNRCRKFIYYGITIGIVSLWSNDYAWLTVAVLFLMSWGIFIKDSRGHVIKTTAYLILVSIISVLLAHFIVTGGHPLKLAQYNFIDMATDQWWYFGPWLEVLRVFSPNELVKLLPVLHVEYTPYVLAVSFVAILIFKHLRLEMLLVFVLGTISLIGGVIASVGGHIGEYYFDGFIFWSKLIILLFGLRLIAAIIFLIPKGWGRAILCVINVCVCCAVIGTFGYYTNKGWVDVQQQRKDSAAHFYVPELGGYLEHPWKNYIAYINAHRDKIVVEEYSGVWSAFLKKPNIWPVDSAIHALGGVRKIAETSVQEKADIVVTSNRAASLEWLAWNQTVNYWFYKILLESYTPVFYSPFTIVWQKDKPRPSGQAIPCKIAEKKDSIFLDTPNVGYYEVQLTTNIDRLKNNRFLTLFENNISFAGLELGFLSISPYEREHALLVYVSTTENRDFKFEVRPPGTVKVAIESCTAKTIPFKNERVLLLSEGADKMYGKHALDYVWDDPYFWDRGIAVNRAGFLVYRDKKALREFRFGHVVELPNEEKRIIVSLGGSAAYLEVYLNGPKLDPNTIGLPTTFNIITDEVKLEAIAGKLGDTIYLTDNAEWVNGVSILSAQFLVANTKKNRELFVPMHRVQIPNTTDRIVQGIVPNGVFLRVYIDGPTLDSKTAGSPAHFKALPPN